VSGGLCSSGLFTFRASGVPNANVELNSTGLLAVNSFTCLFIYILGIIHSFIYSFTHQPQDDDPLLLPFFLKMFAKSMTCMMLSITITSSVMRKRETGIK